MRLETPTGVNLVKIRFTQYTAEIRQQHQHQINLILNYVFLKKNPEYLLRQFFNCAEISWRAVKVLGYKYMNTKTLVCLDSSIANIQASEIGLSCLKKC